MPQPAPMQSLANTKLPAGPVHLAVGIFDGVHLGHRAVIEAAVEAAGRDGGVSGVLTFFPHPSRVLAPEHATELLLPPEVKRWRLLHRMGVGVVIHEPFTREFAAIPAEKFVEHVRERIPGLKGIYVGENWRFGKGRAGDVALLKRLCLEAGIDAFSAPRISSGGAPISSTRIRQLVASGGVEEANTLLGYPYTSLGRVVSGRRLGRTIGFPTLNLPWEPECRPAFGVYTVTVSSRDGDEKLPAVANYGVRPTVESHGSPVLEVHALKSCPFDMGDDLRIEWLHFLRPERKFQSVEALRTQINSDCDNARLRLSRGA